ncbi:MAG: OmpA family protein, partial [Candidatus Zixiibacteriota bacterium]
MKKFAFLTILGLLIFSIMMLTSCGGKKEIAEEIPVDTTPPVVEDPPPELKESQLETAYFDFDKYNLRPDAKSSLDNNYQLLKEFSDVMIKIEGHCDERGTIEYNLSLGEKRAKS